MNSELSMLETVKSESADKIEEYVINISKRYEDSFNSFYNILAKEGSLFSLSSDSSTKRKLVNSVFLSLILASVSSNLLNPFVREFYIAKIQQVCERLSLDYADLLKFQTYEKEMISVIREDPKSH